MAFEGAYGGRVTLDAGGGAGGFPGGGGGGGGYIHLEWLGGTNTPLPLQASVAGGRGSDPGEAGAPGVGTAAPGCRVGQGGLFCQDCAAGTFKNDSNSEPCAACPRDTYSSQLAATACLACAEGGWADRGATVCQFCSAGSYLSALADACRDCAVGKYTPSLGYTACLDCAANTYSALPGATYCTPCAAGYFSLEDSAAAACASCAGVLTRPPRAQWQGPGLGCKYRCDVGLNYPDCLTAFQEAVASVGGPLGFALILTSSAVIAFSPFLFCFLRRTHKASLASQAVIAEIASFQGKQAPRVRERRAPSVDGTGAADLFDNSRLASIEEALTGKARRTPHPHAREAARGAAGLANTHTPTLCLQEEDIAHLAHRVYFQGSNTIAFPLHLAPAPDRHLAPLVDEEAFALFAQQCTDPWQDWEVFAYRALRLLYFPLADTFLRARRRTHVEQLWERRIQAVDQDLPFLKRSLRTKSLHNPIKFGVSRDHTLLWLDVLQLDRDSPGPHLHPAPALPALPAVLVCSGEGTFFAPFQLEATDVLVKAFSGFFGPNWFPFVAALNVHLRVIQARDAYRVERLRGVLTYLAMINRLGIGLGPHMPLQGLSVELGVVPAFADASLDIARVALVVRLANAHAHSHASALAPGHASGSGQLGVGSPARKRDSHTVPTRRPPGAHATPPRAARRDPGHGQSSSRDLPAPDPLAPQPAPAPAPAGLSPAALRDTKDDGGYTSLASAAAALPSLAAEPWRGRTRSPRGRG